MPTLLRIRDDEHVLILTTHHIVSDAWSMGILSRELWSLYEKYTAGKSSDLQTTADTVLRILRSGNASGYKERCLAPTFHTGKNS